MENTGTGRENIHLPSGLKPLIGECELEAVSIGCSVANVFRVLSDSMNRMFLKVAPAGNGLRCEADRLAWLCGRVRVPRVIRFVAENDHEFLLTDALGGVNGIGLGQINPEAVVTGVARELKEWHSRSIAGCLFDQGVQRQIERAKNRVQAGLVDETDFDEERRSRSARDLFEELEMRRPETEEFVLTHGDACLPNVIFNEIACAGFVDCGNAGLADAYQDIALAIRSIEHNLGAAWVGPFYKRYGLIEIDEEKLAFYRLLDEFF